MATTTNQDSKISEAVIEAITDNCDPEDIFDEEKLKEWARRQQPDDIFAEKDLIEWARSNDPEDVFDNKTLRSWAEDNGFVPE